MSLIGIGLELSTTCRSCRLPLPLNGVSQNVLCDRCRTPLETPQSLWEESFNEAIRLGLKCDPGESDHNAVGQSAEFALVSTREQPRCSRACKAPFSVAQLQEGIRTGSMACTSCGASRTVRAVPAWMGSIDSRLAYLVGETAGNELVKPKKGEVPFHCHHCGANLELDGSARDVKCDYCGATIVVPDDVWVRINPTRIVERWYALLRMTEADLGVGPLPDSASQFLDFVAYSGRTAIFAWLQHLGDDHPTSRLGRVNSMGRLVWVQDGVEFSEDARLALSATAGRFWLVDPDEEYSFAREIDADTGEPIRTLESPSDDATGMLSVRGYREEEDVRPHVPDYLPCPDGSFLVQRKWSNSESICLRRFNAEGTRIPLWPGDQLSTGEDEAAFNFPDATDRPRQLPFEARVCVSRDGTLWIADRDGGHIARYRADGTLVDVIPLPSEVVGEVEGIGASSDGSVLLLFDHKVAIGDGSWAHVGRIDPSLQFEIILGPHVSNERLVSKYERRLSVGSDGSLFAGTCEDLSSFAGVRGFSSDGQLEFESPGTRVLDKDLLGDLSGTHRTKPRAIDRQGQSGLHGRPNRQTPNVELQFDLVPGRDALLAKRAEALAQAERAREEAARQQEELVERQREEARRQEAARIAAEEQDKRDSRQVALIVFGVPLVLLVLWGVGCIIYLKLHHSL